MQQFLKDSDAVLDYKFDFAPLTNGQEGANNDWLESGETISTHTVSVLDAGITKDSDSITDSNTSVTVWLSGGTVGNKYRVNCEIVTSSGRTDQRTMTIKVVNR